MIFIDRCRISNARRVAAALAGALALCGCASTCTADSCKTPKLSLGMTEAQVRDVCGCGEPSNVDETIINGKKHVELTYGTTEYAGGYVSYNSGMISSNGYREPPTEHCSDSPAVVTLDEDRVTAIKTGRACRRY